MGIGRAVVLLAIAFSFLGCSFESGKTTYLRAVESGRTQIPWTKEIESLYGSCDHFISHYGLTTESNVWNTETFFGGRYILTMQCQVKIDYRRGAITEILSKPLFVLVEVKSVELNRTGSTRAEISTDWKMDETQWKSVFQAKGDWKSVGINLKTNAVDGFDRLVNLIRTPRKRGN